MKNSWPIKSIEEFTGMHSSEPADRIDDSECALLVNAHVDRTGRVVKQRGVSMVATGSSLRLSATSGRTVIRSAHLYEGRNGEFPSSRLLTVRGSSLLRSKADDLMSAHDIITFPTNIDTPALDRPAAGVFRQRHFYHQNGVDPPFRVECETDDGTNPSTTAEVLGLVPPAYCTSYIAQNGVGTLFPAANPVGYCMTFVYGERGESGPSPVQYVNCATGSAKFDLRYLQPAPTGCTARRIYRTLIGRARVQTTAGGFTLDSAEWEKAANSQEMYLLTEITDSTVTAYSDDKHDSALSKNETSLSLTEFVPPPRPFPPIAKYAVFHLDRIFWSNIREHPYVAQVVSPLRYAGGSLATSTVTISNTGNGTITFTSSDPSYLTLTINNYKTLSLKAIEALVNITYNIFDGLVNSNPVLTPWVFKITAGIDPDRTYTFKEVTSQSIVAAAGPFQFVAIDDTATEGLRWFPNRTWFSEIGFPEQVDLLNTFDITTRGSKKITGAVHSELDASLVLFTEDKPFLVTGDFVPSLDTGVPVFRVDPAIAEAGNICYRPDAVCATDQGIFYVSHDGLRLFRGNSSVPAGRPVQDWFARVLREPVARDQLSMIYRGGILRIALPTDSTP